MAQLRDTKEALEKLSQQPRLLNLPIVRSGAQATVGYAPETWMKWLG